jgi:glutamate dehydrogenase/leucine dehydrogenase
MPAGARLSSRRIHFANAGGVICAAVEYHGGTRPQAFQVIEEKIRDNTRQVLQAARERGVLPRTAAVEMARGRRHVGEIEEALRACGYARREGDDTE